MLKCLALLLFVLVSPLASLTIAATDGTGSLEYDIFRRDDHIAVWINPGQFLTSGRVEHLKDGVDLAIEYKLILKRPKRLWGSEQIAKTAGSIRIGYRIVTEDYTVSAPALGLAENRHFLSLSKLQQYLSDSMVVDVADYPALPSGRRYVLEVKVVCILLTALNLASGADTTVETFSPLKNLFEEFLTITGYGRDEYSAESRAFSLTELDYGH